jgi:ATP-binding cassette, subfamily B, bacterial
MGQSTGRHRAAGKSPIESPTLRLAGPKVASRPPKRATGPVPVATGEAKAGDVKAGDVKAGDVKNAPSLPIRTVFARFWPMTKPYRGRLLVCLLLVATGPFVDAAGLWLFKILIDDVLTPRNFGLFPTVALAYIVITVVGGMLSFADQYLATWVGEKFVLNLRSRLFAHIHRMSLGFFERRQLGDLISRLSGDVNAIEQLVLSGVMQFIAFSVKLVVYGGLLFFLNWKLALLSLVTIPLFGFASRYFGKRLKKAAQETRRRSGTIAAVAEESLSNAALVHSYNRQKAETRRFQTENLGAFAATMVTARLRATFAPLIDLFELFAVLTVIGFSVWQLAQNQITLGGLLVFLGYLSQMYGPIRGFSGLSNAVFAASAGAERIIELLDEQPAVRDPANPRPLTRAHGTVRVEALSFTYPGTDAPSLSSIGFTVQPGQKLAVVGPSGAGKTTLTKMLLRFYDPDLGRVSLDGIDLRALSLTDVRRNMAAVLQETLVFDGTIRDNIMWGQPDASEAEMIAAAEAADAHSFVVGLPDGYDTRVGQRGRLLSGGQRQRLAIARAMIRNAPVLLLDEPTTGLDAASTERVLAPMQRLMNGRTTIVISHNLLTVTDADQILYLEKGRITAAGTHDRLLATSPGYAHLYRLHHGNNGPRPPFRPNPRMQPLPVGHPRAPRHQQRPQHIEVSGG